MSLNAMHISFALQHRLHRAQVPVLDDAFLRDDVHINAVGSDMAGKTELPLTLLHASLVCPDYTPQAILEGECQQLHNGHIGPSLIEIVKNPNAYVSYQAQKTVFDSTGFALRIWRQWKCCWPMRSAQCGSASTFECVIRRVQPLFFRAGCVTSSTRFAQLLDLPTLS